MTETLVAGVFTAVSTLANRQSELGCDVTVVYSRKPGVPVPQELDQAFLSAVRRVEVPYQGRIRAIASLGRILNGLMRDADVVHLHSTFAGLAGRMMPRWAGRAPVIAYSPHGWAFLRGDAGTLSNRAALAVERVLARRCDGLVLVSDSEAETTRAQLGNVRCAVLRNGIDTAELPRAQASGRSRPVVITSGRITEQKAPDRFAELAMALADRADFVWIGDGTAEDRERWFGSAPVEVTGWLSRDQVIERVATADIFVLASRWEGMPISLMEAQAIGLPSVATDIVGNRDIVLDGVTGVLCSDAAQLVPAVTSLIDEPETWATMNENALRMQRERLSGASLGQRSMDIYAEFGGGGPASAVQDQ
ncbi:MAG TPA: glycosyltransferase family 4 protein [Propionibacterium sp.]|nr:glycosyltransferase family 4 protein [Propionibacterium sp.]